MRTIVGVIAIAAAAGLTAPAWAADADDWRDRAADMLRGDSDDRDRQERDSMRTRNYLKSDDYRGAAKLRASEDGELGEYLTDSHDRPLYMFTEDRRGDDDREARSDCYDDCAEVWPPLLVEDRPEVASELDEDLVGTIEREDGEKQVTYNGWPLYYYARDRGDGDVRGQDKHGFGGEWYLVKPNGARNERKG